MEPKVINILRDFSRYPVGRYISDGPFTGEKFRTAYLAPALSTPGSKVIIEFDGARGYGSSFLEEAFGGMVRAGMDADEFFDRVELRSSDKSLIEEIRGYIREAEAHAKQ